MNESAPSLPPCPQCGYGGRTVAGANVWTPHGYAGRRRRYQCPQGHKWATMEMELRLIEKLIAEGDKPPVLGKVVSKGNGDNVIQFHKHGG